MPTPPPNSSYLNPDGTMAESRTAAPQVDWAAVAGEPGLRRSGSYLLEERHPMLRGSTRERAKFYDYMAADSPTLGGALYALEMLVRKPTWEFEAAELPEDAGQDLQDAAKRERDWYQAALEDLDAPWSAILSEAFSAAVHGYAIAEILYKVSIGPNESDDRFRSQYSDGMFRWRDFAPRGQDTIERWDFDRQGRAVGFWQWVAGRGREFYVPLRKCLHWRVRSRKRSPEGHSLLRPAVRPYVFETREEEYEAIGIERNLAGMPTVKCPPEALHAGAGTPEAATVSRYLEIAKRLRRDDLGALAIPHEYHAGPDGNRTGWEFALLSPEAGQGLAAADPVIKRHRQNGLTALLMSFLVLGTQGGSHALGDSLRSFAEQSATGILDTLAEPFNSRAVPELHALNGRPAMLRPRFVHGPVEQEDIERFARAVSTLVHSGTIVADDETERWARDRIDAPPPEARDEPRAPRIPISLDPATGLPVDAPG